MTQSTGQATVTAFFDSRDDARRAQDRLAAIGVPQGDMRLTEGRPSDALPEDGTERSLQDAHGFFDALRDFFFPEDDHATYAEGLSRGGYLLTVQNLSPELYDTAVDVLDDEGAVDIDERADEWRNAGWQGHRRSPVPPEILSGAAAGGAGAGTSGMAGMDTPHAGVTADRDGDHDAELRAETGESRGTVTAADRRGDLWQRDMARGRARVRTYLSVPAAAAAPPPLPERDDDDAADTTASDATERNNLPS